MSDEKWKWVTGYEGLYMVSDKGRLMGLPKKTHYGHIMKTKTSAKGYETVCLCKNGVKNDLRVHMLVANAFVSNPHKKPEVNHRNGVRSDNRAVNLEWATRSENELHAYSVLNKEPNRPWAGKPRKFARKFTDEQVLAIREDARPLREIGNEYGVSKTAICNIKTRRNYREVI